MVVMTGTCWWAFTYTREGFIPQMYGSFRVCCAATTELVHYTDKGVQWGDCESEVKNAISLRLLTIPSGHGRQVPTRGILGT